MITFCSTRTAHFGYQTATAVDPDALETISVEYVEAFRRRDQKPMRELGVPFEVLLGPTEAAEAQHRAGGKEKDY